MAQVTLTNLTKYFDRTVLAVDHISLEIQDKEFMVLVGPSGCGKSTTLRMIAGLEEISSGTVTIGDRVVNEVPPKNRDIAMVFQNYALYPHMSVYDNLAFGLKLRKYPKAEIARLVQEAAEILGISEYLGRKPKALSGGQRQRVAVGRAIVRKPKAFLFDEPLSNLDAKMRVQMRAELSKLHHRLESTMIYVTHDQVEAMTMGDRICVMKDGLIQQVDEPLTLYDHPANLFVAGFIGTPPMNLCNGRPEKNGDDLRCTDDDITVTIPKVWHQALDPYTNKPIVFGIRPEDLGSKQAHEIGTLPIIKAKVEIAEPMGSETNVHVSTKNTMLIARIEAHQRVSIDSILDLPVMVDKAHFFDAETEKLIV